MKNSVKGITLAALLIAANAALGAVGAGSGQLISTTETFGSLDLSMTSGRPGDSVAIRATLRVDAGVEVVATENNISFEAAAPIAAQSDGTPDCAVNPAIRKSATVFAFLPTGCSGTACTGVRAIVVSTQNSDPIPDGSILYTCTILISSTAADGTYPLTVSAVLGSGRNCDPLCNAVALGSTDGQVEVLSACPEALVAIDIGTVRAASGQRVSVPVRLDALSSTPPPVAGTQNDIFFEPPTRITASSSGDPDCAVNPRIVKNATTFAFLPPGCTPDEDCTGVRAFVLASDNILPIPEGSVLYTCTVQVAADEPLGSYPLRNGNAFASDPSGQPVPACGHNGQIDVICPGDCDGNGQVSIFELIRGVNIALGTESPSACPAFDTDGNGKVTINEIIVAVATALRGCSVMQ